MTAYLYELDTVAAAALLAAAFWHFARHASVAGGRRWGAYCAAGGVLFIAAAAGFGRVVGRGWNTVPAWGGAAVAVGGVLLLRGRRGLLAGVSTGRAAAALALAVAGMGGSLVFHLAGVRGRAVPVGLGVVFMLWLAIPAERTPVRRQWLRTLAGFLLALVWMTAWVGGAAYLQVADAAARRIVTPTPRLPMSNADAPERFGWERVHFAAVDGVPLVGWWMQGPRPASVIICHGHGDNKGAYVPFLHWLRQVGWSAFAFDLRTHGESGGQVATLGVHEQRDLEAAVEATLVRQARLPGGAGAPVVVFAYSMGGTVATPVVARDPRIAGLVIEGSSPYPLRSIERISRTVLGPATPLVLPGAYALVYARTGAWVPGLRTIAAVGRISPRPVLVIHGMRDALPVELARELYAAAGEPKQYFEAPHSRHVAAFFDDRPAYSRVIVRFLDRFAPRAPEG